MKTETKKRVVPVLRWPGGKSRMLKQLLPMIPEHECYCEPFAGGLAVLFAKQRSPVEVINDLNGDLVALYRMLQYHLPELEREIGFLFGSRQLLKDFMTQPGLTEIQRAARFLVRNRTSFSGNMTTLGVTRTRGGGAALYHNKLEDLMGEAAKRLDGVIVENLSYERCLKLYDSPDTFFFLDPPYLHADPKAYSGWDEDQMAGFRKVVTDLKGRWIITIDDSPFNRGLFKDCCVQSVQTRNQCVNNAKIKNATFGELIITP